MGALIDMVEQYLKDDDWNFERVEEKPLIHAGIKGDNASFNRVLSRYDSVN